MQFILDHLSALIISSVVILIVALIQVRSSSSLIESHVAETVEKDLQSMHDMLQWDISQMATETITNQKLADGKYFGGAYTCQFSQSGNLTDTLTFTTLDRPYGIPDSLQPHIDSLHVIKVSYILTPYGDSTLEWSGTTQQQVPLYRLERSVNDTLSGYLSEILTGFRVEQLQVSAGPEGYAALNGPCPNTMRAIRYEYSMVTQGVDFVTTDQLNTNRLNQRQFGTTVNLVLW